MENIKVLHKRQLELEREMLVAKDMIWRLTNRTITLENEVKYLKPIITETRGDNSSGKNSYAAAKTSRIAEIARRRYKRLNTSNIQAERDTECQEEEVDDDYMSDASISAGDLNDTKTPATQKGDSKKLKMSSEEKDNSNYSCSDLTDESNESDDDEDYAAKVKVKRLSDLMEKNASLGKRGRKKSSVWKYFHTRPLAQGSEETSGFSKYQVQAFCKFCKAEVSSKADRLKAHIKRCDSVNSLVRDSFKKQDKKRKTPVIVTLDDDLKPSKENNGDSKTGIKSETSQCGQATVSAPEKAPSGRRKNAIWQHYNTEKITVKLDNGTEISRVEALCKRCNKQISAKTERLLIHWKKCSVDVPQNSEAVTAVS